MVAYGKCALRYLNLRFYENNQATSSVDSDIKSPDHLGQEIFQYLQEPPGVWGIQDENFINVKIDGTNIKRIYEVTFIFLSLKEFQSRIALLFLTELSNPTNVR